MCVYMFTCMHTEPNTSQICVCVCVFTYTYEYTQNIQTRVKCMCACTCSHVRIQTYTRPTYESNVRVRVMFTCMHTDTHDVHTSQIYVCVCVFTSTHRPIRPTHESNACVYVFTRMHTDSHLLRRAWRRDSGLMCWLESPVKCYWKPDQASCPSWLQFAISSPRCKRLGRPNQSRNEWCHTMIDCQSANLTSL